MRQRLTVGVAIGAAAAVALAGCGSSSGSKSSWLKGDHDHVLRRRLRHRPGQHQPRSTGRASPTAFHTANPTITVKVTTINWTDFDNQVQTLVQNHQYPDITEGDYFSDVRAGAGLLYPAKDVLSDPLATCLPVFQARAPTTAPQYGMPFTTSSRTLFYNKKLFAAGRHHRRRRRPGPTCRPTRPRSRRKGKIGFGLPLGSEEAQAESLLWFLGNGGGYQDASGKYAINSAQNVAALQFLQAAGRRPATPSRTRAPRTARTCGSSSRQGKIGMINGSPALIPIIQSAGVLTPADWTSVPIAGQDRPADAHARRVRQRRRVQAQRSPGADQEVPRLRLPGQVPARSSTTSTTCCRPRPSGGDRTGARPDLRAVPQGAAELGAVPERHRLGRR